MKLFEKSSIGKMNLKNRIIMGPMGTSAEGDGGYSRRIIRYYEERAKGGTGMIITGMNQATDKYEDYYCNLLSTHHHVSRLGELADALHRYECKLCVQIGPGLGRMATLIPGKPVYSASATPLYWRPDVTCTPYSVDQIKDLVKSVSYAANLAKRAGADAVELHAYGGYLLDQFQCSLWNKRDDEYGGDLRGRMKIVLDIIANIRRICGPDFPLIVKFTPMHCIPGGRELSEGLEMVKIYEETGVDALHVDKGFYDSYYNVIPTVYQEEGSQMDVFSAIKQVATVPVLGQGKLFNPVLAEQVLNDNKLDFIVLAHQMMADPSWANKVKSGKTHEIVPCIGCNECLHGGLKGTNVRCSVNPLCQHEDDYPMSPPKENKSILVLGGGPGGMTAAISAAERGFNVKLWEKSNTLGGLLNAAGAPSFKKDVRNYVQYLIGKLYRSNIEIQLNKDATAQEIKAGNFDKVIVATGADAVIPPIPGVDNPKVISATDMLLSPTAPTGHVIIIGGGLVGCEAALHCAQTADHVTIIEFLDRVLKTADHARNNDQLLKDMLKEQKIDVITSARVTGIDGDNLSYEQNGKTYTIFFDNVAIAVGFRSNNKIADELEALGVDVTVVGDAIKPAKILTAVHGAYSAISII